MDKTSELDHQTLDESCHVPLPENGHVITSSTHGTSSSSHVTSSANQVTSQISTPEVLDVRTLNERAVYQTQELSSHVVSYSSEHIPPHPLECNEQRTVAVIGVIQLLSGINMYVYIHLFYIA